MDPRELTGFIKEYALSHGADLVGVLSPDAIDEYPDYWIGWQIQESSKRSVDYLENARSISAWVSCF